ncbi:aldehyde dehydrogenase [Saitoella complicata NRRL Y-17804]|uniref:Aldehyde dehydrogenase domain-containing protein n=1 Tax=Saitoella complicata (strain BCRC 22490 / CBS 7301 / JCM 7358 / NBRC 10748 / NRRL Y-17804) TaxID=698492 RepID=A0A0E9N7N8_SAICN|nr:aldehyde dehydrogenase [Saitoella complicata NRRL Y-17804]ODQ54394.1 aldehyde dehydrogenase [Saitoella complicata NRRL Y-17804]GAO45854.1 hypothetical protein G7K_0102-t1 [Saitoella complicata NRRL Y-17804]
MFCSASRALIAIGSRSALLSRRFYHVTLTLPIEKEYNQPVTSFINNEHVKRSDKPVRAAKDPSTTLEICEVSSAFQEEVDKAVIAAQAALAPGSEWTTMSPAERGRRLYRLADAMEANKETLCAIEAWNAGKPRHIVERDDFADAVGACRYFAGMADKINGRTMDFGNGKWGYTIVEPIGVCGLILPFNFPLSTLFWYLAPALAYGNALLVKPSEHTPLSALYLTHFIKELFPPGVINILPGGSETGACIASHPSIDKVAFTGSSATGRRILDLTAASNMKSTSLELGGKSPLVVCEDADIETAVEWAHGNIFYNAGQVCSATSRLLVHRNVAGRFIEAFVARTKAHKVGSVWEDDTFQGPINNADQYEKVKRHVRQALDEGAKCILGGIPLENHGDSPPGWFIAPTIFTDVTPTMSIFREEIFGPIASITTFTTLPEAIELANNTSYTLGAAIFTKDMGCAQEFTRRVRAGQVWVNSAGDSEHGIGFGGRGGMSGWGKALGEEGGHEWGVVKSLHIRVV